MRIPAHLCIVLLSSVLAGPVMVETRAADPGDGPDPPPRELRGVFVTTAYNLDWPSRPGLHYRVQTDEIRAVVGRVRELNCNVIFLQVRAFGGRIHRHTTLPRPEPWSAALNRRHDPDTTPTPAFDPLAEWIRECHKAGIELHAWVNPFRVDNLVETGAAGDPHPTTLPASATADGHHLLLNPRSERVQSYVIGVVRDLLDYRVPPAVSVNSLRHGGSTTGGDGIDGVMFDHFPYPKGSTQPSGTTSEGGPSGDEAEDREPKVVPQAQPVAVRPISPRIGWLLKKAGPPQPDPNPPTVDDFIFKAFTEVYTEHGAKFGLSPEYGDERAKQWFENGWVNYVIPELYFRSNGPTDFKSTLESWLHRVPSTFPFTPIVVAGLFTTRVQSPAPHRRHPWPASEIEAQIGDARSAHSSSSNARASGQAHYAWSALRDAAHGGPSDPSNNIGEHLKNDTLYGRPALVPQCTVAPEAPPGTPSVTRSGTTASWQAAPGENKQLFLWAVWLHDAAGWGPMQVFPASQTSLDDLDATIDRIAVAAVDRHNQVSPIAIAQTP